jgi:superfamily II DNA/RNA helicase
MNQNPERIMPNYSKPSTGGKKPYTSTSGGAAGHRGQRPTGAGAAAASGAAKKRWTTDDRAARTGDRPTGAARPERADRRPDWTPRDSKPSYQDRAAQSRSHERGAADRPSYGDRTPSRPTYGDRPSTDRSATERPAYGDRPTRDRPESSDRASSDRAARPDRTERPAERRPAPRDGYADRANRTERPARDDRTPRTERPSRDDRPTRGGAERPNYERPNHDRPNYDRADRPARPAYGRPDRDERPARPSYGRPSYDKPSYDRADRPARPAVDRSERPARPAYDRGDRPARPSYDRAERPARPSYDRSSYDRPSYDRPSRDRADFDRSAERAPRRESAFYPDRQDKTAFVQHDDVVLERLEAAAITASDVDGVTFADLGLGSNIVRQLASMGAEAPFAIQAATIPDVLAGKDVLGRGKTGSGKTIAFGAPLVERLMENNGGKDRQMGRKPRALILAPTRELALQIDRTVQPIARSVGLFTTTIVGGVPQFKQVSSLQRGVDIVIATPGRVEDLVEQGRLDLSNVFVTVLDEADHMCDLGFLEPVQRILRDCGTALAQRGGANGARSGSAAGAAADGRVQKLLFSATLDKGVATLVEEFLVNPAVHEVAGEDQASSSIDHKVLLIEQRDKRAIIEQLASGSGRTLIFTRTRAFAEEMSDYLEDAGIPATSLHGDLNQSRRTRNLQLLTSGRVNVLVATDVAARGIHVDDISLVIQADAPEEYKTYLHRSGRTGRAGKVGTVVTLVNRNRRRKMDELLGRAEIEATSIYAAPGDALLDELAAL